MVLDFFRLVPKKRTVKIKSKNGIIFSNPSGTKKYLFYLGTFAVFLALGYFCYLYWPLAESLIVYKNRNTTVVIEENKEIEENKNEENLDEFWIKIPQIGATAEIKKGVSPYDKTEYLPILQEDLVAQAKGTGLPGEGKMVYLFAHSTKQGLQMVRSNSVFYLLGELKTDDLVFVKYYGKVYKYRVYNQKVVAAKEVEYLEYKEEGKEVLILQTCWPLGTDWKRLLVFAERI